MNVGVRILHYQHSLVQVVTDLVRHDTSICHVLHSNACFFVIPDGSVILDHSIIVQPCHQDSIFFMSSNFVDEDSWFCNMILKNSRQDTCLALHNRVSVDEWVRTDNIDTDLEIFDQVEKQFRFGSNSYLNSEDRKSTR